jgi:hypothetical protein
MQPVPFDDADELLYIRIKETDVFGSGVLPAVVQIPDWSANRARFSEPEDVLIGYPGFTRVGEFRVGDIPPCVEPDPPEPGQKRAVAWQFWAEHDPIPENDAHSEVRMRKDGESYVRNKEPGSKTYKKKIRNELARIVRVRQ